MRSIAVVTVVVVLAAWATLHFASAPRARAPRPVSAATVQNVRSISLVGDQLPQSQLRQVLETRPGAALDPARLERDRAAMERKLADLGYLAARVEPASVILDDGAAYVVFEIDQGKLFHLRTIEVTGAGKDAAVVTLTSGDEARRDRIEHARATLADALARRGKSTSVELSVHTDIAAAAVDVTFTTRVTPKG